MSGIKYDENKPQMSLIDFEALEGLAKVLTFGANKYGADNWRGGIANSRIVSSLLRHLSAYQRGEDFDPESGLSHLDHIGCNWMFLSANAKQRPHCDDRSGCAGTHTGAATANPGLPEAGHSANTENHLTLGEVIALWQARYDMEKAFSDS